MGTVAEIRVRGYHLDFYGHVNNARYLEFLEEGRWTLLEAREDLRALLAEGLQFNVVNIDISYRRPATLGQVLLVDGRLGRVGVRSATVHQEVRRKEDGELVADADVTFVLVDPATGRSVPLAGRLAEDPGRVP